MCEPTTIALIAAGASALVSAGGAYIGAQAQADQARAQAKVSGYLARDAIERGRREEQAARERARRILGMQRAAFGASGGVVDVGSALDVLEDTAYFGELDALTIRANAEREAWYHRSNRAQAMAAASDYRMQGYIGAASSLLAGAGSYAQIAGNLGSPPSTTTTPRQVQPFYTAPYRPELGSGYTVPGAPRIVTSRGARSLG